MIKFDAGRTIEHIDIGVIILGNYLMAASLAYLR
jgi:hypothetical protein